MADDLKSLEQSISTFATQLAVVSSRLESLQKGVDELMRTLQTGSDPVTTRVALMESQILDIRKWMSEVDNSAQMREAEDLRGKWAMGATGIASITAIVTSVIAYFSKH